MAEIKTTQKDLFVRIMETMSEDAEVVEMCEKYIDRLSRPRKKTENKEAVEFRAAVATYMSEHEDVFTNAELAEAFDVSSQKMSSALRVLVEEGVVARTEGKASKDKATFTFIPCADDENEEE